MIEFTFISYKNIIQTFQSNDFKVVTFLEYIKTEKKIGKFLIHRHDVDRFPLQTQQMARMEAANNIKSTYYFRIIPSVFKPEIIREVAALGHEIGYHYEDLSLCGGDPKKSIEHFERSLDKLREFYPVETICMHGSPLSKWDNKTIWQQYDYRQYGIIADTSFDVDYQKVFYITDNGRAWNRTSVSVRDKVDSPYNIPINNSFHLIDMVNQGKIPNHVMINAHPDTFFDFGFKYMLNWAFIETKNIAKWVIVKYNLRK
ncbi:MAG TPA: hypothetical protein DIC42_05640 [Holosporales bacterium]|nr:hypothetical protein [Holosporales bacterium]